MCLLALHLSDRVDEVFGLREKITILQNYIKIWNLDAYLWSCTLGVFIIQNEELLTPKIKN